jgi:hypothetical protein
LDKAREESIFWAFLGGFLALIMGVILVVLSGQLCRAGELRVTGVKTAGVIYRIESKLYPRRYVNVYVRYSADGEEYRNVLNYYNRTMRVGDKIDIYYDPQNPLRANGGSETKYVLLGIGIMITGVSVGFFVLRAGVRGLISRK